MTSSEKYKDCWNLIWNIRRNMASQKYMAGLLKIKGLTFYREIKGLMKFVWHLHRNKKKCQIEKCLFLNLFQYVQFLGKEDDGSFCRWHVKKNKNAKMCGTPCWSMLDFWKINLEKSSSMNWIFSLHRTVCVACKNQIQN